MMAMAVADALGSDGHVPAAPRRWVLVADDSFAMRDVLHEVLDAAGYEVTTVASGARALEAMADRVPDLVITDLLMPGMSGFSLRAAMLRRPDLAEVPVIVLSGYWQRPGETLEAAEVITKPLSIDRLLESVRRLAGSGAPDGAGSTETRTSRSS
jgi:CheY-like chemotaxis protein